MQQLYSIRPVTQDDKDIVLCWRNHPDVRAMMLSSEVISPEIHDSWWNNTLKNPERQILIFERENKPLGVITIYAWNSQEKTAWWGFYLNSSALSNNEKITVWLALEQAVIAYAENTLSIYELYCESLRKNILVWQLHKRCGFIEIDTPTEATQTDKSVIYMKYVFAKNKPDLRPALYLLSSYNADFLTSTVIKLSNQYPQFPYQFKSTAFGQYQLWLLDEDNSLSDKFGALFFAERLEDFFPTIHEQTTTENIATLNNAINEYLNFIKLIKSKYPAQKIYISDFFIQKNFPHSLLDRYQNANINKWLSAINLQLINFANDIDATIIPYASTIVQHGSKKSWADKYWYLARNPFSYDFLNDYSQTIIGTILASHSRTMKALVLDLDNTLWHGVIGDDGIDGISLGGDYPGNIYKDLQAFFLALKQNGILLTICSKNTESIALDAINTHPDMVLQESDFVIWKINWQPKSENIRALAEELNIGIDSLCFIDDNPVERNEVRLNLPNVFVPELPSDPASWLGFLAQLPEFYQLSINDADRRRAELYKQRVVATQATNQFSNREDYLKSLNMKLSLEPLSEKNFDRVHQLFNKTNQFNTTTTRYSKEQLRAFQQADDYSIIHVKLSDKYQTEAEGIAALVIQNKVDRWHINNFVMSCRVMGREVESAIIDAIVEQANQQKTCALIGHFLASEKNMPVADLYYRLGFEQQDGQWTLMVNGQHIELKKISYIFKIESNFN